MLQVGFRLLFVLLIFVAHGAHSQCDATLNGLVEDENGEKLIGATIWIESLQRGVTSDFEGKFVLPDLCPGQHRLLIKYVGFEDQVLFLKIPINRSLVVKLRPSTKVLHDIVVEGNHSQQHSLSQSLGLLSEEQLALSKGKPLGEMLQQVPGVQSIMTGNAIFKPVIHGLYGQRIAILNNGVRQEGQQWGVEHAPEVDTYIASEIEVVKGAESVRFGADALGGAIIIKPQPLHYLNSLGYDLSTSFSSNNRSGAFSAMLEGGFSKRPSLAWRLQGTVKRGGDFHAPAYTLSNTGAAEYDMSAAMGFKDGTKEIELYASSFNSKIGILRSAHTGNLTDLQQSIASERPWYIKPFSFDIDNPYQDVGHHLIKISSQFDVAGPWSLKAQYGFQLNKRKEFDVRRGRQDVPSLSLRILTHTLDATLDHTKKSLNGSIGVSGTWKDNFNEGTAGLLPDYQQYTVGIFIIEKFRKEKWLFEGGVRFDRQHLKTWLYNQQQLLTPEFDFNYFAASFGTSVHINNKLRFSSNAGISERPPHLSELYSSGLHHSAASVERGLLTTGNEFILDENLVKPERSHQWVNTFQYHNHKNEISLELSAFLNYFSDYIYLTPQGTELTIRGYFPVFRYQQTNALLTGADLSFSANLSKHLSYSNKASFVMAEDRVLGNRLPFVPPLQFDNGITYKKTSIQKWKSFYCTVTAQTALRQTRAPEVVYPEDLPQFQETRTFDFMPSPEGYTLIKIESGIKLPLDNRDLTVSVTVDNLFDKSYRNYLNRLRYYADEAGRNFTLRINYTFHSH